MPENASAAPKGGAQASSTLLECYVHHLGEHHPAVKE